MNDSLLATLYKRNKNGKLLQWSIYANTKSYWTESGQVGGKLQTTLPTFVEQKNVGKANETSLLEQVQSEVTSKIQYQLDHGYSEDIPSEEKEFAVSLADKYVDRLEKGKLDFPYIVEPKLDGLRCSIRLVDGKPVMLSRNNKPFVSCPHICEDPLVQKLFAAYPDIILDGELYNHDLKNDFNKIVSLVKKSKPTKEDLEESAKLVQYHCFDAYFQNHPGLEYTYRKLLIEQAIGKELADVLVFHQYESHLRYVGRNYTITRQEKYWHSDYVHNVAEVEELLDVYIAAGYEGIMLKKDVPYFFGRSFDMLKYKRFHDKEFEIVDFEPGKGNLHDVAAIVTCKDDNGNQFSAGVTGTKEYARNLLANKTNYIGKMATIKYQELTPIKNGKGGVPRFGKMMSIRDYE